jgi:hypothetical protein
VALSDKKKQAKKQRKQSKRKRSLATRARESVVSMSAKAAAIRYASFPVHEALYTDTLGDRGITNVLLSRRAPDGSIGAAVILLDVYCLGVKDAFFSRFDREEQYEDFKDGLLDFHMERQLLSLHPSCLRKLIQGGIDYAQDLGFSPHKDYAQAAPMLREIETAACPQRFEYGKNGKPTYISGPNDSPTRVLTIIDTLEKRCGEGNFNFINML